MSSITTTAVAPNSQHRIHACEFVTNQHCDLFFSLLLALGLMFTIFFTYCDGATDASRHSHYNSATKVIRICYSQHIIWFHTKTGANFFFLLPQKINIFFLLSRDNFYFRFI